MIRRLTTRIAEGARAALGLVYLGGAVVHLFYWATNRDLYAEITQYIRFEWYQGLWTEVVLPNLGILLPVLALFELLVALAILSSDRFAKLGLAAGAAFNVAIAPLGFWWPANVALAAVHLALVRLAYPETTVGRVRRRLTSART